MSRTTYPTPERALSAPSSSSRFPAGVTGAAVLAICVAYAGWSLFSDREEELAPPDAGIALGESPEQPPALLPPGTQAAPVARLTLDNDPSPLPVLNAHHETPTGDVPDAVAPAVNQLGYASPPAPDRPAAAWLTGGIEPDGSAPR